MINYSRISDKISKFSESQIQSLFESMSLDNEMLFSIIESLTSGILIVDNEWKPRFSNKASERYILFSTSPNENSKEKLFEIVKDKDISDFFKKCYEKNSTNVSEEFTVSTLSGTIRFLSISVMPFICKDEVVGNTVVIRDITDKRNQEILLHRMEHLASLTNVAASVAHEIKNPLGAISIHIQLLQKAISKARKENNQLPDEKFLENYLNVVNEEIDNLNKSVVDFLFAVRPVSAKLELLYPNRLIKKIMDFFKPEFEKENITLDISLSTDDIRLLLDEKLFKDVVINLSQNSIYAINENLHNIQKGILKISSQISHDKYILKIFDNGIGISESKLAKIFEPYYTTKATGTGLGLTTVYKIIKEFSGDINVKSVEGEGTEFTITLPIPQLDKKLLSFNQS